MPFCWEQVLRFLVFPCSRTARTFTPFCRAHDDLSTISRRADLLRSVQIIVQLPVKLVIMPIYIFLRIILLTRVEEFTDKCFQIYGMNSAECLISICDQTGGNCKLIGLYPTPLQWRIQGGPNRPRPPPPFSADFFFFLADFCYFRARHRGIWIPGHPLFTDPGSASATLLKGIV